MVVVNVLTLDITVSPPLNSWGGGEQNIALYCSSSSTFTTATQCWLDVQPVFADVFVFSRYYTIVESGNI